MLLEARRLTFFVYLFCTQLWNCRWLLVIRWLITSHYSEYFVLFSLHASAPPCSQHTGLSVHWPHHSPKSFLLSYLSQPTPSSTLDFSHHHRELYFLHFFQSISPGQQSTHPFQTSKHWFCHSISHWETSPTLLSFSPWWMSTVCHYQYSLAHILKLLVPHQAHLIPGYIPSWTLSLHHAPSRAGKCNLKET